MKTVNDYVLMAMEEISKATDEELETLIKKGETISKLAEVSIRDKEAETKNKEVENKKTEMLIKAQIMQAQLTGDISEFEQIKKITCKSGDDND